MLLRLSQKLFGIKMNALFELNEWSIYFCMVFVV